MPSRGPDVGSPGHVGIKDNSNDVRTAFSGTRTNAMSNKRLHLIWWLCMLPSIGFMGVFSYEWIERPVDTKFLIYAICSPIIGVILGSLIVGLTGGNSENEDSEQETASPEIDLDDGRGAITSGAHSGAVISVSHEESASGTDAGAGATLDSEPSGTASTSAEVISGAHSPVVISGAHAINLDTGADLSELTSGPQIPISAQISDELGIKTENDLFKADSDGRASPLFDKAELLAQVNPAKESIALSSPGASSVPHGVVNFSPEITGAFIPDTQSAESRVENAQKVVARLEAEVAKAEAVAAKLEVELAKAEPMAARLESAEQANRVQDSKNQDSPATRSTEVKPAKFQSETKGPAGRASQPESKSPVPKTVAANEAKALPNLKTADEWLGHAKKMVDANNFDEAIKCCDKVTAIDVKNFDAWYLKGTALKSKKRFDDAVYCFSYALGINSASANALSEKGECLLQLGKAGQALIWFDKSLQIDKVAPKPWFGKAQCMAAMGKHKEAVYCFDKVLAIEPGNEDAKSAKKDSTSKLGVRT